MKKYSRREFLHHTTGLLALAMAASAFNTTQQKPLLSFSTLGCPDWSLDKIVNFAKDNGYDGIEIRTIQRQLDLPKITAFSSPQNIAGTNTFLKDKGVKIVDLGASSAMHYREPIQRKKNLDEAKRFIDLAQQVNCRYIRVFPNDFPKDQQRSETIDLIVKGLLELGDYAKGSNVIVLMESHGQVVKSDDLQTIMKAAEHPHVGLVWDIVNMWFVTKEDPAIVYDKLKPYIHHAHIKDLNIVNDKEQYTLLGKGESPIFKGIDALYKGGYKGYYSFEWEKLWHPDIAEPEVALADYPNKMKEHFRNA